MCNAIMWCILVMSRAVVTNCVLHRKFYTEQGLFRNEEQVSVLIMLLESLKPLKFNLTFQVRDIDKVDYWTTINLK